MRSELERIALCQNPEGEGQYVPLSPGESLTACFVPGCECVPVEYVRGLLAEPQEGRAAFLAGEGTLTAAEVIAWAGELGRKAHHGPVPPDEPLMVSVLRAGAVSGPGVSRAGGPGGDRCPEGWTTEEDVRTDTLNEAHREELRRIAAEVARGVRCPGEGEESRDA